MCCFLSSDPTPSRQGEVDLRRQCRTADCQQTAVSGSAVGLHWLARTAIIPLPITCRFLLPMASEWYRRSRTASPTPWLPCSPARRGGGKGRPWECSTWLWSSRRSVKGTAVLQQARVLHQIWITPLVYSVWDSNRQYCSRVCTIFVACFCTYCSLCRTAPYSAATRLHRCR